MHDLVYSLPDFSTFSEAPPALVAIIQRLTMKLPEARYHNADEVLTALKKSTDYPFKAETSSTRESFLVASEFVGRSAELTQLVDLLPEIRQSHGAVWLVGGESGVGKSRLMSEIRTQA